MSTKSINMLGKNHDFIVLTDEISGRNSISYCQLIIPFKMEFFENYEFKNISKVQMLSFKGELSVPENGILCSQSIVFITEEFSKQKKQLQTQFYFNIPIDIIAKIEKHRKGDLSLSIAVVGQAAKFREVDFADGQSKQFVIGFESAHGHINFKIAQSNWIELLRQMGYQSFRIIELPELSQIIPAEYSKSLNELEKAKDYFLKGDYDKAVGHCRAAIDPFKPKKEEIRKYVSSKSEFNWAMDVIEATDEWLLRLVKSTVSFTSKTHHAPSTGHFDRAGAEIVMMITTAIVAFIGKVDQK